MCQNFSCLPVQAHCQFPRDPRRHDSTEIASVKTAPSNGNYGVRSKDANYKKSKGQFEALIHKNFICFKQKPGRHKRIPNWYSTL